MEIKIPYDKWDLKFALFGVMGKVDEEKIEQCGAEIKKRFGSDMENKAELNRKIAESNGITLEMLVNSPNYEILKSEYAKMMWLQLVKLIKEQLNLTDKEAWAVLVSATTELMD
jgi:hypothetical protein